MSTPMPRPAPVMNQTFLSVISDLLHVVVGLHVGIQPPDITVGKARVIGVLGVPPYQRTKGVGWT
jgi:hypothetical protein